jgi:hypothetical protein
MTEGRMTKQIVAYSPEGRGDVRHPTKIWTEI